ncbi:MAG: hypothetical protein ABI821_06785 [Pseudomonadota bacterium]
MSAELPGPRELLPWYVNGTLSARERAAVEGELAASGIARDELRLWREVAREVANEYVTVPQASDLGWRRLSRQLNVAPRAARTWRIAAGVLVAVLGAQTVFLVQREQAYRDQIHQLGSAPAGVRDDEWRVQVRFRATATAADINRVLSDAQARLVDGPSALGVYEVAMPRARFADAQSAAVWLGEQAIVEQSVAPP